MIIKCRINSDIEINKLEDLIKLKPLKENANLKLNVSKIARELGVDRRTVKKYIDGYIKPEKVKRKRSSKIDQYYDAIIELLSDEYRVFAYISVLWKFMVREYKLDVSESNFRNYIRKHEKLNDYFKENKGNNQVRIRYETELGEQAQLDWKETIEFTTKYGEVLIINIFVLLLGYSRFRVYRLSLTKTQDILFNFLNDAFEIIGGVPKFLLTDNMKTVMDIARTKHFLGKVNNKFQQFANDYGFEVKPCISRAPETKGKVEAQMKIIDELKAYNGSLDYSELVALLEDINNRENTMFHRSYQKTPVMALQKEKDFLLPLPCKEIRSQYLIGTSTVKVNKSSMISFKSNQYSVPSEYVDKTLKLQCYDNQIYLYFNTKFVCSHSISKNSLNYKDEHYLELTKNTFKYKSDDEIEAIAKANLKMMGDAYNE
jgi:transposase